MGMYCDLAVDGGETFSLEKAWHGLYFLLTRHDNPLLGFLLEGGEPDGDDDDYGPPRRFGPDEVKDLDAALAAISDAQLWAGFDAERMEQEGIYPGIWDEPEDDLREEYLFYFHEMKRVVHEASRAGRSLVVGLN